MSTCTTPPDDLIVKSPPPVDPEAQGSNPFPPLAFIDQWIAASLSARAGKIGNFRFKLPNNQTGERPPSRGLHRPGCAKLRARKYGGRRECRMLAAPAALRADKKSRKQVTTGQPNGPAFPAQWF
ncbi:hypothetical protein [Bradyrhizobium sp.]|uniref:hypothetical protein n=1 Tax=Bradyrhizobium sp. TaxID=376 RepID=UPI00260C6D61|nr:hypothetical protein [Bradyrhizobium sp.]